MLLIFLPISYSIQCAQCYSISEKIRTAEMSEFPPTNVIKTIRSSRPTESRCRQHRAMLNWTKRGCTCLCLPLPYKPVMEDFTLFGYIERNPGPMVAENKNQTSASEMPHGPENNNDPYILYLRDELLKICSAGNVPLGPLLLDRLKSCEILKYRGNRIEKEDKKRSQPNYGYTWKKSQANTQRQHHCTGQGVNTNSTL